MTGLDLQTEARNQFCLARYSIRKVADASKSTCHNLANIKENSTYEDSLHKATI
jgi:hypothetical protein